MDLSARIERVFAAVPRPGPDALLHPECRVVAEFLKRMAASPEHADAQTAQAALDGFWADAACGGG